MCRETAGLPASAQGLTVCARRGNGALPSPFAAVFVRGPRSIGSLAKPGAAQNFFICSMVSYSRLSATTPSPAVWIGCGAERGSGLGVSHAWPSRKQPLAVVHTRMGESLFGLRRHAKRCLETRLKSGFTATSGETAHVLPSCAQLPVSLTERGRAPPRAARLPGHGAQVQARSHRETLTRTSRCPSARG